MKFPRCKAKVIQTHSAMNGKEGAVVKTAKAQCTVSPLKEGTRERGEKGERGGRGSGDNL